MALKNAVMQAFNELVETHQTFNLIRVEAAPAAAAGPQVPSAGSLTDVTRPVIIDPAPAPPEPTERIHEVVKGDTLSALAKKYLGNANLYMKIFEANRDTLTDPNLIKPGQRLRIPN
ncbi:MAG: LysM peptidoglycan-binding domain-containing protein [Acidobacteria bacterium]|nr:LysM peptidoglycan-binding domain-containing protein [Acidobacteriota bacterium]